MPWHIETDNPDCAGGFAVVKDEDGAVVGCHETEASAEDQITALNVDESPDAGASGEVEAKRDDYAGISPRQKALADGYESLAEHFGQFDQSTGADGAHYISPEDNTFKDAGMACGNCVAFRGGGACEWVSGEIDPAALCKLWVIAADKLGNGTDEAAPDEQAEPDDNTDEPAVLATTETEEVASVPETRVERAAPLARVEWRESGAGPEMKTIRGYAAVFNSQSHDLGGFREVIAPGAFAGVLGRDADVRLLYNHDDAAVMARTKSGTLELAEDETGLRIWARVDMADLDVQRVMPKMLRADVDQMSFAFTVEEDEWDESGGYPLRTIRSVGELYEVSIVPFPAYEATKAEVFERARSDGRVLIARATPTVAEPSPGGSESQVVDLGMGRSRADEARIRAAKWRARLTHHKINHTR